MPKRMISDLTDDELKLVIKSLSLTYDATSKRVDRLSGRHRAEALAEVMICDNALTKAKAEMNQRWTDDNGGRIWPIGTPPDRNET